MRYFSDYEIMSGKRALEHNKIVENSAKLLHSDRKYQEVDINGIKYLAERTLESIISKISGQALDQKYVAKLIGRIENGKVIPLSSGDISKRSYFIDWIILSGREVNDHVLGELRDAGFDVSNIKEMKYIGTDFFEALLNGQNYG